MEQNRTKMLYSIATAQNAERFQIVEKYQTTIQYLRKA